jgi:signal transduction histidine kinase
VNSFASHSALGIEDGPMTLENEALQRCERLLALMSEAMEMERALGAGTVGTDATLRSVLRPILEDAIARLEPMMSGTPKRSLQAWVRELVDLELELDAAIAQRGWRTLSVGLEAPPVLSDPA